MTIPNRLSLIIALSFILIAPFGAGIAPACIEIRQGRERLLHSGSFGLAPIPVANADNP
jgi:hypothetical protein